MSQVIKNMPNGPNLILGRMSVFLFERDWGSQVYNLITTFDGWHYKLIESRFELLPKDKQSVIYTQSKSLIDCFHFESVEDFRSRVRLFRPDEEDHFQEVNLESSVTFFAAQQVGIQHTSEILQLQGLW